MKYNQCPDLARPLGQALGGCWQHRQAARRPPLVVPIPMHAHKQRQRGFNQAALIAEAFCARTGLPLAKAGLLRTKATTPQFGLGLAERQHNLSGAFALGPYFQRQRPTRPVLLLDDIYTTGTTMQMAALALRRSGVSVCGAVVVARATLETPN